MREDFSNTTLIIIDVQKAFEGIEPGKSKTVETDLSIPIVTVSNNYSIEAELSTGNGTISKSNQIEVTPQ